MKKPQYPEKPVLVVDDETAALKGCERILRTGGIDNVVCMQDSRDVLPFIETGDSAVMILDLAVPHVSGEEILSVTAEKCPRMKVIVMTASNEVDTAVKCMKMGALDYMVKPVEECRLISGVSRAIELWDSERDYSILKTRMLSGELEHPEAFAEITTHNAKMHSLFEYVETISPSTKPVLITGETGVGKELIARAIHVISGRPGEFVATNSAGLEDTLFSDTLFGHKKGAFTGAGEARNGLIERASGGTLFLDEIGDLSAASQIRLLRLLQEHEYFPLGSDVPRKSNARIVVATNHNIDRLQESGQFRKDLYYRLKTHQVHMPPLRERLGDIPALVDHFAETAARSLGKKTPLVPEELPVLLTTYDFPGNVRELEEMIFDAICKNKSNTLPVSTFRSYIRKSGHTGDAVPNELTREEARLFSPSGTRKPLTIREATDLLIVNAMVQSRGNQGIAAELLGISRAALNKRLQRKRLAHV